jgi:hypothetical protein
MANKMFLNRQRTVPTTELPAVSRARDESYTDLFVRNSRALGEAVESPSVILDETS